MSNAIARRDRSRQPCDPQPLIAQDQTGTQHSQSVDVCLILVTFVLSSSGVILELLGVHIWFDELEGITVGAA